MTRRSRTRLVQPKMERDDQTLKAIVDASEQEQTQEPALTELDSETECPRCHDVMELQSSFDKLMYSCESCSFLLKCV